jgi:putative zinc finger/helix-turn-helix YgiT family protein
MTAPTSKSNEPLCDVCGSGEIEVVATPANFTKGDLTVSYADEFSRCKACGDEFYTRAQSIAHEKAIAAALREAQGLPTGMQIRAARINIGLTLEQLEKALNIGKNTGGRWERDTVAPIGAATAGLWFLINNPTGFLAYAKTRGVEPKKRVAHSTRYAGVGSQAPTSSATLQLIRGDLQQKKGASKTTEKTEPLTFSLRDYNEA